VPEENTHRLKLTSENGRQTALGTITGGSRSAGEVECKLSVGL